MNQTNEIYKPFIKYVIICFVLLCSLRLFKLPLYFFQYRFDYIVHRFDDTRISIRMGDPPNVAYKERIYENYTLPHIYPVTLSGPKSLWDDALFPHPDQQGIIKNETIEFFIMKDVYINRRGVLSDGKTTYVLSPECIPRITEHQFASTLPYSTVVPIYDHVITAGHQYVGSYAHFTCDFLPVLFSMPQAILDKSTIIFFGTQNYPFLQSFGFPLERLKAQSLSFNSIRRSNFTFYNNFPMLNQGADFVFARHLYTVLPCSCDIFKPALLDHLRVYFVEKLKLESKPFRYVIYNRKMKKRGIANFKEIYNAITTEFPSYPWEKGRTTEGYLGPKGCIQYYHETKFLFAVHGAVLANTIFMQPGSVVCELMIERWTPNFMFTSVETGKKYVMGRDEAIPHSISKTNIVKTNVVLDLIAKGLTLIED